MKIGTFIGFALGSTLGILAVEAMQSNKGKQNAKAMLKEKIDKILE